MTIQRLSVTATMLLGIDRFVALAEDGIAVPHSTLRVQPWLCGEALLGGALWTLWTDGVVEPTGQEGEFRRCGRIEYPAASLECRVQDCLSDRPEPLLDTLLRTLDFAQVQPWHDVVQLVYRELLIAGYPVDEPPPTNGHRPRFLVTANDTDPTDAGAPMLPAMLARLSARWDRWWSQREDALVVLARACHDALVAHRLRFARTVMAYGLPLTERPPDPAEAAAGVVRPRCPRWARRL